MRLERNFVLHLVLAGVVLGVWTTIAAQTDQSVVPKVESHEDEVAEIIIPKWTADLRAAIGSTPLGLVVGQGRETHLQPKVSLWFSDENTIIATFVIAKEGQPILSKRNVSDASLPLRLCGIFLDAETGTVTATRAWPTNSRLAGIVAAHEGKFVAQTGLQLTLYSAELKELKNLKLPQTEDIWAAHPSPTGRNILFIATNLRTRSAVPWIWVDADNLEVVHSWEEPQSGYVSISDNSIAMTKCVWFYDRQPAVEVRALPAEWKVVTGASRVNKPRPQFVAENVLFLLGNPSSLLQTDGKILFGRSASSGGCWSAGTYPSADGRRFVVPSCRLLDHVALLDLGGTTQLTKFLVYDAPFHGLSNTLQVKWPKIKEPATLALSPNGAKLAVLSGEMMYVFQLPPQT